MASMFGDEDVDSSVGDKRATLVGKSEFESRSESISLEWVRDQYLTWENACIRRGGHDGDEDVSLVVMEGVSPEQFDKYYEVASEDSLLGHARQSLVDGRLTFYEAPLAPREIPLGSLRYYLNKFIESEYQTDDDFEWKLHLQGSTLFPIGANRKEADSCMAYDGAEYPNVVVEIGWSQTMSALHESAQLWLGALTTVQAVLSIKAFQVRADGTFALLVALYLRSAEQVNGRYHPVQLISCGTAPVVNTMSLRNLLTPCTGHLLGGHVTCNAPGMEEFRITIPKEAIYHNVAEADLPTGGSHDLVLDLFKMQKRFAAALR